MTREESEEEDEEEDVEDEEEEVEAPSLKDLATHRRFRRGSSSFMARMDEGDEDVVTVTGACFAFFSEILSSDAFLVDVVYLIDAFPWRNSQSCNEEKKSRNL